MSGCEMGGISSMAFGFHSTPLSPSSIIGSQAETLSCGRWLALDLNLSPPERAGRNKGPFCLPPFDCVQSQIPVFYISLWTLGEYSLVFLFCTYLWSCYYFFNYREQGRGAIFLEKNISETSRYFTLREYPSCFSCTVFNLQGKGLLISRFVCVCVWKTLERLFLKMTVCNWLNLVQIDLIDWQNQAFLYINLEIYIYTYQLYIIQIYKCVYTRLGIS